MRNLFCDLDGQEKETLFIIGNGFDLYHSLPTSYLHFYHWLKDRGEDIFIAALEKLYPDKYGDRHLLWYDFESALGDFDVNSIFKQIFDVVQTDWSQHIDKIVSNNLSNYINHIKDNIKEWAKDIDLSKTKRLLPLPADSKYLTFNYTHTLEEIYKISESQICHIHGSCKGNEDIVIGHNTYINIDKIEDEEVEYWAGKAKVKIAECMCGLIKDCGVEIHQRKTDFFKSIKGINRIVVLGHSLSPIDQPYFGQIKILANKDVHWHISKYSSDDEARIDKFLNIMNISKSNRWIFNY